MDLSNTSQTAEPSLAELDERGKVVVKGLWEAYGALEGHQLAMYHGWGRTIGFKVAAHELTQVDSDQWFDVLIGIGGYRSGKTFSALVRLANDATQYPGNLCMVVRKHHEQLHNTFLKDFKELLTRVTGGHPEWLVLSEGWVTQGAYEMQIATPDPLRPSRVIFKIEPSDATEEGIRDAFKGYECGLIIFEEATQLSHVCFDVLQSRMSKKIFINPMLPQTKVGQPCVEGELEHKSNLWPGFKPYMLVLSNPGYDDHWLEVTAEKNEKAVLRGEKPLYMVVRSTMEDNRKHLPEGHIEREKARYADDPIGYQMYIDGLAGTKVEGQPVFQGHYSTKHHRAELYFNDQWPLIVGADWGYQRPRALFAQFDETIDGLNVLDELKGVRWEAEEFGGHIRDFIRQHFRGARSIIPLGDPSGFQKTDKGDPTVLRINKATGLQFIPSNNDLDAGHEEMRRLMRVLAMKGGEMRPLFQHSPRCKHLELALRQGYTLPVDSKGRVGEKPNPRNPFKDIVDALRYIVMGMFGINALLREQKTPWSVWDKGNNGKQETVLPPPERLNMD